MGSKNKVIMTIVSFFLLSLLILPNLRADLDKESLESAQTLANAGIIVDNSKNPTSYNISSSISRREMLKIMLKLAGVTPSETCEGKFGDLPKTDWGCKYAETALKLGYLAPNKYFRPNDQVSKVEALKMLFKAKGITPITTADWREGYVKKAVELGYSATFSDYNSASKRSFVFNVGAKTISNNNSLQISQVKEQFLSYEKPKLKITFASAMNKTSVLSNLKLYPEVAYTANWSDDKNLELTLDDLVREETDILVNVLDAATTAAGEKLPETYVKKFKVDGEALIEFVTPNGNISDLSQNITVRFSKPMVALTNLDNQALCPVEINPNIPGKCVWITTSTFQFRPEKGFPTGGKYSVNIPSGLKTIAGDTTINSKSFEIATPAFALVSDINTLGLDEPLKFAFNDEVSLDAFKNNFALSNISNDKLTFAYYKGSDDLEASTNIVTVFPKSGDWGYGKTYTYTISKNLTSARGNVGLSTSVTKTITTQDLLVSYSPAVFVNEDADEKYATTNLKFSQNNAIIPTENPKVVLSFYKDMPLDKNLISSSLPFELHYTKVPEYVDGKSVLKDNKIQILVSFSGKINGNFSFQLNLSKFSSTSDKTFHFSTKANNQVVSYKQITYKKACLETKNPLTGNLGRYFSFDKYGKVDYVSEVNEWTRDADCSYSSGKNRYILNTRLNPNSSYKLTISQKLLDSDNYPLDKDYSLAFVTTKALNEDKSVSIIDGRNLVLVPTIVKPLTVGLQSVNISQAQVKVCAGNLDVSAKNYQANPKCETKTVPLTNLGFKPNISVIDLEKVFGSELTQKYVTLEVSKMDADKTEYEAKNDYYIPKASFVVSDIAATIKSAKNNILWLHDYNTGKDVTDGISKIESYRKEAKYSVFGAYEGEKVILDKTISFTSKANGLYELSESNFTTLLITLKSGDQVILDNVYSYYYGNQNIYTYISTDRPIYKAGDTVEISGISRILDARGYSINTAPTQISVRDNQYKQILNMQITPNSLGAYGTKVTLPLDAKLGNYTIEAGGNTLSFAVEAYEKPDFKVETVAKEKTYLYGNAAKVSVSGEYYIGLPLSNANGTYTLSSTPYYFDGGKTSGYSFGKEQNYWWGMRPMADKMGGVYYGGSSAESSGNFVLDTDGKNTLSLPLTLADEDKIYTVSSTVTDPNTKKSVSSNASFTALRSSTFLGMKFDKYYYAFGDNASVGMVAVDKEGNKLKNQTFSYKVYKVDYTYDENTYTYNSKEKLISEKSLSSGDTGMVNDTFAFTQYGEYRFEISNGKYTTTKTIYVSGADVLRPEEAQNSLEIIADKDMYTVGNTGKFVIASPVVGVKALITIEKLDEVVQYKVIDITSFNQEISIDIKKEYLPNFNVGAYIIKDISASGTGTLEELKNLRAQMLTLEQKLQTEQNNSYTLYLGDYLVRDLTIWPAKQTENLDTDTLAKLRSLRDKEREILNKMLPAYYIGSKDIKVSTESVKITSKVKTDKESYLPGDAQTLELTLTDSAGKPVNGEVTLAIIDQSLLALKNNTTDILDYFYANQYVGVQTLGNLTNLVKRIEFKVDEPTSDGDVRQTGGGQEESGDLFGSLFGDDVGAVAESSAPMAPPMDAQKSSNMVSMKKEVSSSNPNETRLRTELKDLAFYKARAVAKDGKVTIQVPALPDNLTTWTIAGYAYSADSKVGNFESNFKVQKSLSILPQVPRFFLSGDKTEIGALVVNNSKTEKIAQVTLDMNHVDVIGDKTQRVTIAPNSSALVNFAVLVQTGVLDTTLETSVKLTATSGNLTDSVLLKKTISPSVTSEYVFTNGTTDYLSYEEKLDFEKVLKNGGYLEVSLGATILTNLTKNLDKVLTFPSEDLGSKLTFLENALALESLYSKLEKSGEFKNISLTDYNGGVHKVGEVMDMVRADVKNYVQRDGGLAYYKDCSSWWFADTCSSMYVTADYLNLGISVDGVDNQKVFAYYKAALTQQIEENKKYNIFTTGIDEFLPVALYKDADFVKNYFKPRTELSNIEKLDYIKLYEFLGQKNDLANAYLTDLKNAVLVEARGSVLPADKSFATTDNSVPSAKMIQVLLKNGLGEKLLTQNLVRFLLSNRNDEGNYYTYDFAEIVDAISAYIESTGELKNVSFEAKAYLNSKDLMTSVFNEKNKFDIDKKTFNFADYIQTGENSLGFEKTGSGKLYYDVGVRYYLPVSEMSSREEGMTVSRNYYDYDEYKSAFKQDCFTPWWYYDFGGYCTTKKVKNIDNIASSKKGEYIVGQIQIILDKERTDVVVNDYIPAGAEILNTNLNTTSNDVKDISGQQNKSWWQGGFDLVEQKDDRVYLYAKHLAAGTYTYTYVMRANHAGNYNLKPATAELLEKPEIWGRSNGGTFEIK